MKLQVELLSKEGRMLLPVQVTFRNIDDSAGLEEIVQKEAAKGRPALDLRGRIALLVDDGLATGSTMLVAARYVRSLKARRTLIAVPVASVQACERLKTEADDCICLAIPEPFVAVGQWYADFPQVTDSEVQHFLEASRMPAKGVKTRVANAVNRTTSSSPG
jgi:predicted phosphoribosyltransferase